METVENFTQERELILIEAKRRKRWLDILYAMSVIFLLPFELAYTPGRLWPWFTLISIYLILYALLRLVERRQLRLIATRRYAYLAALYENLRSDTNPYKEKHGN